MFGRSPKLPIHSIFDVQNNYNNQKPCDKFVAEWEESMQQVIDITIKNANNAKINKIT